MMASRKRKTSRRVVDEPHAEYNFAVQEYRHTVAPASSNDDGLGQDMRYSQDEQDSQQQQLPPEMGTGTPPLSPLHTEASRGLNVDFHSPLQTIDEIRQDRMAYNLFHSQSNCDEASTIQYVSHASNIPREANLPDTIYEEEYGDAYIGAPIKYVYPSGYQSMRPRGGPWKLSIAVCVLFTWLSVFIVGHCSDRAEQFQVNQDIDDDELADALVIATRWCNSRLLYITWVVCTLITGLAMSYCCVIGYIKVRDFAVANCRSQPPGLVTGKSDYYVRIDDGPSSSSSSSSSQQQSTRHPHRYERTIYQADGTPQFWGGHIYRPTQAAVAVTSR